MEKKKYRSFAAHNFRKIPQLSRLSEEELKEIEVVAAVLPFKTNNYVVDELIDWDNWKTDPMFLLTFPQRKMLQKSHYEEMAATLARTSDKAEIRRTADSIRMKLNPHPAGQMEHNVPYFEGERLSGIQHKYRETVLFFPTQGQTCHAYCTFCFRWPQFVGMEDMKFAMNETEKLVEYVRTHDTVTDVLFTGGDPMIMKTRLLAGYIDALLDAKLPNLHTIRIGTKALAYWPERFTHDDDAEELMALFERAKAAGVNISIMAHFSHPVELETQAVREAIARLLKAGVQIRTQSPLLRNINDKAEIWTKMWRLQVDLGCIPYYMFIPRDTGAKHYFEVPLEEAWEIFRNAYQHVSGICRTVRGPSMSCTPGKVQVLGVNELNGEKVFVLRMLQGRNPDWAGRPFFAKYDPEATWMDELQPLPGQENFFFEEEELLEKAAIGKEVF